MERTANLLNDVGLVSLAGRQESRISGFTTYDFCSKLVQKGADLYSVAGLVGHKDVKTTQRYVFHLSPEKLRSTIQILNSGDNLATVGKKDNHQYVVSC